MARCRWLIIADDLTGAADCAMAFAKVGLETLVIWNEIGQSNGPVLALNTESRFLSPDDAACRQVTGLAARHRPGVLVYKKIDSTLRGQPAAELAALCDFLATLRGGRAPMALVAPAFPGTGRSTEKGSVRIAGCALEETVLWARDHTYCSAHLPDILAHVGMSSEVLSLAIIRSGVDATATALADARARGVAAVVCDAVEEVDLATIAAASLPVADQLIWVGSGGLAIHLARLVGNADTPAPTVTSPGLGQPVLVIIGSVAEASRRQAAYLAEQGMAHPLDIGAADLFAGACSDRWREIRHNAILQLGAGQNVVVLIAADAHPDLSRGSELAALFAELVVPIVPAAGGLVMTGGDTAGAVLAGLGVHALRLVAEVEPGVPLGITVGPLALPFVTKAGAFGDEATLARCLARLRRNLF